MRAIRLLVLLGLALPLVTAASSLEEGDAAWSQRADGFREGGRPLREPAERALRAYEAALAESPDDLEIHFRLIDALYFAGFFVERESDVQRRLYQRAVEVSDASLRLVEARAGGREALEPLSLEERAARLADVPEAAAAHFWAAISWGLWAMAHHPITAARVNAAGRIRDHGLMVIRLDPAYLDGGGYRLLGRLHMQAPIVPLFSGWVNRDRGLSLLRKANAESTRDVRNPLFLAEALLQVDRAAHLEEARDLLREVAGRTPSEARLVEQTHYIGIARRLLEEIEAR